MKSNLAAFLRGFFAVLIPCAYGLTLQIGRH